GLNIGKGRRRSGLHNDRVSRDERRPDLISKERKRKIPRHDRRTDTDRLLDDHSVTTFIQSGNVSTADGLRQTSVVFERVRKASNLEDGFAQRLALLHRQETRQILLAFL